MKTIITFIISLFICMQLYGSDTSFVTPAELEEGWGLYWTNPLTENIPEPKTIIFFFEVSPDGNWLYFHDDWGLQLLNLYTNEIKNINNKGTINAQWCPYSNELYYLTPYPWQLIYYNVYTQNRDTVKCYDTTQYCSLGGFWAYDNYSYFAYPNGRPDKDSIVYKMNNVLSRKIGYPVYEPIIGIKYPYLPDPIFPPDNIEYFVHEYINMVNYVPDKVEGFDVVRDFNYNERTLIRFSVPDTNWVFDGCNTAGTLQYARLIEVGPRDDVYFYLSFRAKKERENFCDYRYWDSSTIAARNASGWYRCDTSGKNMVQLVRSWTYGMGGLSITADGETIYYGMLMKDTNAAIWRMDRFGRNKKLVLNLGDLTSIKDQPAIQSNKEIFIFPNPAANTCTLKFHSEYESSAIISISDILGRNLRRFSHSIINGENTINFNVEDLPPGLYFVRVYIKSDKMFYTRFVKE